MRFILGAVLAFLSLPVFSGYSPGTSLCFAELGEAVTSRAGSLCVSGACRILSYSPSNAAAIVISGSTISTYSISPCANVNTVLPASSAPTPWYGTDPGTVSACGSIVQTSGGIAGSGGSGISELVPFSMSVSDAQSIAVSILFIWAIAFAYKLLYRVLNHDDNEPKAD